MNPVIREQLHLIRNADIPEFDETTTHFVLARKEAPEELPLIVGKRYLVELADYVITLSDTFNLHANWNNNNPPNYKYFNCIIMNTVGKMIYLSGDAINMSTFEDMHHKWTGWLPRKSISIIKEIT